MSAFAWQGTGCGINRQVFCLSDATLSRRSRNAQLTSKSKLGKQLNRWHLECDGLFKRSAESDLHPTTIGQHIHSVVLKTVLPGMQYPKNPSFRRLLTLLCNLSGLWKWHTFAHHCCICEHTFNKEDCIL